MEKLKELLVSIDLNNLLKIFDIQIAIGVLIFFILFRTLFSKIIIKICYKLMKETKNAKESAMYKPLNTFFILLGVFIMINILPTNKQLLFVMNKIFKIVVIYYIMRIIATLITEDSFIMKKILYLLH